MVRKASLWMKAKARRLHARLRSRYGSSSPDWVRKIVHNRLARREGMSVGRVMAWRYLSSHRLRILTAV